MPADDWKWFFYDGLQVLAEGTATDDNTFFTCNGSAIGGIIARDDGTNKLWYHFDRLGNVVGVTDENGDVVRVYSNDAFGWWFVAYEADGYNNNVADVQWYHLTTKEWDLDTDLYYFNARWYDRNTGRFVSRDPVGCPDGSEYLLSQNNPIVFLDPDGRDVCFPLDSPVVNDSDWSFWPTRTRAINWRATGNFRVFHPNYGFAVFGLRCGKEWVASAIVRLYVGTRTIKTTVTWCCFTGSPGAYEGDRKSYRKKVTTTCVRKGKKWEKDEAALFEPKWTSGPAGGFTYVDCYAPPPPGGLPEGIIIGQIYETGRSCSETVEIE